jgi:hypothetical protein
MIEICLFGKELPVELLWCLHVLSCVVFIACLRVLMFRGDVIVPVGVCLGLMCMQRVLDLLLIQVLLHACDMYNSVTVKMLVLVVL